MLQLFPVFNVVAFGADYVYRNRLNKKTVYIDKFYTFSIFHLLKVSSRRLY